ncbi:hypothetical protein M3J09_010837 [Ascochyta lentis]
MDGRVRGEYFRSLEGEMCGCFLVSVLSELCMQLVVWRWNVSVIGSGGCSGDGRFDGWCNIRESVVESLNS